MELYNTRVGDYTDDERKKMIFKELQDIQREAKKKSIETTFKSDLFWWINTILNLIVVVSSAAIVVINAFNLPSPNSISNLPALILGAVIFTIASTDRPLKLGARGYYYRQTSYRLKRLIQQTRDITYTFQNFTNEEILAYISSMRVEMDEIDLEMYRSAMPDEGSFPNNIRLSESGHNSSNNSPNHSPNRSPQNSPYLPRASPRASPRNSPRVSFNDKRGDTSNEYVAKSLKYGKSISLNSSLAKIDVESTIRSISEPNLKSMLKKGSDNTLFEV
jgi:hypothetical protein